MITILNKFGIVLYLLLNITQANAQSLFQNYYGSPINYIGSEPAVAFSPDAYYLAHLSTAPNFDSKIFKADLNGNLLWAKSFDSSSVMRITYNDNSIFLTGSTLNSNYVNSFSRLDTAGNILWTSEINYGDINVNSRIIPNSAGYLLAGHRDYLQSSLYTFDITLAQFDFSGNFIWGKAYGDLNWDYVCNAATITPGGKIIVAGLYGTRVSGQFDAMLACFDGSGSLLWMESFADGAGFFSEFWPSDIAVTSDGNYAITGRSRNTNGNFDAHVIKIDSTGNILWGKRLYQISWHEAGRSVISDSQGNIIVTGSYELNNSYGDFAARLDNSGALLAAAKFSNTYKGALGTSYGSYYEPRGAGLSELAGFGYISSTKAYTGLNNYLHSLISSDYNGIVNCSVLGGSYPFVVDPVTWTITNFSVLPTAQTNISAVTLTYTASSLTELSGDICPLVGVEELNADRMEVSVFPNPAVSELTVYGTFLITEVKIRDVIGKIVFEKELRSTMNFKIQLENISPGIYIVEAASNDKKAITKFLKID